MASELKLSGTTARVILQGNDTITSDQTFTFPDSGGQVVTSSFDGDVTIDGNATVTGIVDGLCITGRQDSTNSAVFRGTWDGAGNTFTSVIFGDGGAKFGPYDSGIGNRIYGDGGFVARRTDDTQRLFVGLDDAAETFVVTRSGNTTLAGKLNIGGSWPNNQTSEISNGAVFCRNDSGESTIFESYSGGTAASDIQIKFTANGNAVFSGSVTAANVSDIKFKENITDAKPQLSDVVALGSSLKNWDWKEEAPLNDEIKARRFLGLIAQEAEETCPGITYEVANEGDTYKAINHDILVMKLLGAVAEQNARIEQLESRLAQLEGQS